MGFYNHRDIFKGKIDGISVKDLQELDYDIENLEGRLEFLKKKYEKTKCFLNSYIFCKEEKIDGYIDYSILTKDDTRLYYKYSLNKNDSLSENNNIFKTLENDGSYLINSKDAYRSGKVNYVILDDEDFEKAMNDEIYLEDLLQEASEEVIETIIFLADKNKNDYCNMELTIKKEDYSKKHLGEVLKSYLELQDKLKLEMMNIKNKQKSNLKLHEIKRHLKEINDDMLLSKNKILGIRNRAKRLGDESGCFDLDCIDYKNPKHIKAIVENISLASLRPDSDLSIIGTDVLTALDKLLKDKVIDNLDYKIIINKNKGYDNTEIADMFNRDEKTVRRRLEKVYGKIVNIM